MPSTLEFQGAVPNTGDIQRVLNALSTTPGNSLSSSQVATISPKFSILAGANAGTDSGWLLIGPHAERLLYQLDTGTTSTGFTVDISIDGVTSLGQAWTGTYNSSTVAEFSPPMWFTNPLAKYFRVTITSGGPISFQRCA